MLRSLLSSEVKVEFTNDKDNRFGDGDEVDGGDEVDSGDESREIDEAGDRSSQDETCDLIFFDFF